MGYKAIAPATDWLFVVFPVPPRNELVVWRLAAWGVHENGDVIGLISVAGGGPDDGVMGGTCRLISVPPLEGVYKHVSELTVTEATAVAACKPIKVDEPGGACEHS